MLKLLFRIFQELPEDFHSSVGNMPSVPQLFLKTPRRAYQEGRLFWKLVAPYLLGVPSFIAIFATMFFFKESVKTAVLGPILGPLNEGMIATVLGVLVVTIIAAFGAVFVILGGLQFQMEKEIACSLERRGYISKFKRSVVNTTIRVILETIVRIVVLSFLAIIFIGSLALPFLTPFVALLGIGYIGCDIMGMCLSSIGLSLGEQLKIFSRYPKEVFLLGFVVSTALSVPIIGLLILPLAFMVCGDLITEWADNSDEILLNKLTH